MEVGPIFRALINNKSRFWLITIEIALTLAVVVNCVNMVVDQQRRMNRETGLDEANTLVVEVEPFAPEFKDDEVVEAVYDEDVRMLKALPGVIAATGTSAVPLSGGGSASGRKAQGAEGETKNVPYFVVGERALEAFGVKLVEGREFDESDFADETTEEDSDDFEEIVSTNVIVTREVADVLFPDGGALGGLIQNHRGTTTETIVGIIERMHCAWPQSAVAERAMFYPGRPAGKRRTFYMVRAEPGMVEDLYTRVETELLALNEGRLVDVKTLAEIKADLYSSDVAFSKLLGGLSVLLVFVTSLGIVGLTSFSVTQRTHEIGTRRALGATRLGILRHFLVENWVVTSVGLTLGLLLVLGLNFALARFANVPTVGATLILGAMVALWLVGLLAALVPALRGMRVSPVIATRNLY